LETYFREVPGSNISWIIFYAQAASIVVDQWLVHASTHNPQSHEGTFRTPALYLAGLKVKLSIVAYTDHNNSRSPVMVLFLLSPGNFQYSSFNQVRIICFKIIKTWIIANNPVIQRYMF
jgi:hypothetical protein